MPNTDAILETVGALLQNKHLNLLLDTRDLLQPVGSQGVQPRHEEVRSSATTVEVYGQPLRLDAAADGDVQIYAADAEVEDLFVGGETFKAPEGTSLAALGIYGTLELGSEIPPLSQGALTLTFTGSSDSKFGYQHLLPVWQSEGRVKAFTDLALTSRLPSRVQLEQLRPGEVHRLDARVNLSLGVQARWGKEFDLHEVVDLWRGLSAGVRAHAAADLQASLGWSLYEEMQLTVGRANLLNPGWVRLRLQRSRRRHLTLGTVVALQASYDGSDLATVLQQTLDQSPLPRLIEAFRPIAAGDWETVKAKLTDRVTATLDEYLDTTGWQQWLEGRPEVQELVDTAHTMVEAYDGLDGRIQSWWDRVLGQVDLSEGGKAREVLQVVAGIGGGSLNDLIENKDVREALDWIEALTGKSLEDLVLGSNDDLEQALQRAAELAQQTLDFLDNLPDKVRARVDTYAGKLGVRTTLDWLSQHATSKADLIAFVDAAAEKRLRQLVERLLDKAWGRISEDDLAAVRAWAQRLVANYDRLEARFRSALEKFKGELGFSLSITIDRLSQREALLDLEVDPTDPQLNTDITSALRQGNVRGLLEALPPLTQLPSTQPLDEPVNQPSGAGGRRARYLVREAVLSEKRVRTATLSVLFRFLGLQSLMRNQSQWTEEAQLEVRGQSGRFQRKGTYAGGFRRANSNVQETEAAVWFETAAADSADQPLAPFAAAALDNHLRLTYGFQDAETTLDERVALDHLLAKLGFLKSPGSVDNLRRRLGDVPILDLRLAVEIRIGGEGVTALLQDLQGPAGDTAEASWNEDYLRAAQHWFQSPVLAVNRFDSVKHRPLGEILLDLTRHSDFEGKWRQGPQPLTEDWLPGGKKVEVGGQTYLVKPFNRDFAGSPALLQHWRPEYNSLYFLAANRGPGLRGFRTLAQAVRSSAEQGTQAALVAQSQAVAEGLKDAHPGYAGLNLSWNCPLFLTWLVLTRLSRVRRQSLKEARGVATLRWRAPGSEAWQEPLHWKLDAGIPVL